jgi:hypothetical protein
MLSSLNRRLGLRNFKGCCVLELWYVLYTAIWFLLWQVKNVAKALRTNLEDGFSDSPEEIQKRKEAFGDNTYPKKKPKGFLTFVWEACHDTTLIILMVAAVVSLGTSMWADVSLPDDIAVVLLVTLSNPLSTFSSTWVVINNPLMSSSSSWLYCDLYMCLSAFMQFYVLIVNT